MLRQFGAFQQKDPLNPEDKMCEIRLSCTHKQSTLYFSIYGTFVMQSSVNLIPEKWFNGRSLHH